MQDCTVYLKINESIYNHDDKQIAFMLLLLDSGEPALWKEQYLNSVMKDDELNFITFGNFLKAFGKAFQDINWINKAINNLGQIKQENKGAEEHNTTFWLLVRKARIFSLKNLNNWVLIDLYQKSLKPKIFKRIMSMENISETIEEWYEKAILFNNNWQYLMTAMECTPRDNCSTGQN